MRGLLDRQQMGGDDILDIDAAIEKLVCLRIFVAVGRAHRGVVVLLGKEPRRAEDDAGQAVPAVQQLAQVLGGELGDAVDVFRRGTTSSVIQAAGPPGGGVSASPKALVVLVKTNADTPAASGFLQQIQRAGDVGVDKVLARMGGDMRLVQRRGVQDGINARHARRDEIGDPRSSRVNWVNAPGFTSIETTSALACAAAPAPALHQDARNCR